MDNTQDFPQNWVFIRGLTRSHFHWFDFKTQFENKFKSKNVFAVELPGSGELSKLKTPCDISKIITELKKQLPNLPTPFGVIGISFGGMIATQWAIDYPSEISHIVLMNTSSKSSPFYHRFRPALYFNFLKAVLFPTANIIEKFILTSTCNTKNWESVFSKCVEFQIKNPIQISNLIQQLRLAAKSEFKIKPDCKTLILASKNDRLANYKCSLNIAQRWGLTPHIHPTAGHDLPLDDSTWILEQIQTEFNFKY